MSGEVIQLFKDEVDTYREVIHEIREINEYRWFYNKTIERLQKHSKKNLDKEIKQYIEGARNNLKKIIEIFDEKKKPLEKKAKELEISLHSSNKLEEGRK